MELPSETCTIHPFNVCLHSMASFLVFLSLFVIFLLWIKIAILYVYVFLQNAKNVWVYAYNGAEFSPHFLVISTFFLRLSKTYFTGRNWLARLAVALDEKKHSCHIHVASFLLVWLFCSPILRLLLYFSNTRLYTNAICECGWMQASESKKKCSERF